MAALNIANSQILPKPVTSFLQGKAMRLAQENQRIANEAAQAELDYIPEQQDRARASDARAERGADRADDALKLRRDELDRLKERDLTDDENAKLERFEEEAEGAYARGSYEDALVIAKKHGIEEGFTEEVFDARRGRGAEEELPPPKFENWTNDRGDVQPIDVADRYAAQAAVNAGYRPSDGSRPKPPAQIMVRQEADRIADDPHATEGQIAWANKVHGIKELTESESAKEAMIERLTPIFGSKERATKFADEVLRGEINEKTGTINFFDMATNSAYEIPIQSIKDQRAMPAPDPQHTMWQFAIYGTGLGSSLVALGNVPVAWSGLSPDQVTNRARQALKATGLDMVRSLSNNPKFPEGERKAIQEEISITPKLFDDPILLQGRLQEMHRNLSLKAAQFEFSGSNPSMPQDKREMWLGAAGEIRMFLPKMGVRPELEPGTYWVGKNKKGEDVWMFPDGKQRIWSPE